jgi:hypothetical protein
MTYPHLVRALSVALGLLSGAPLCQAASFTVTIDTMALADYGTPPAPFTLEFQLLDLNSTVRNTVTLSDFDFGPGGGAFGTATTSGGASGDLAGTVTLTDSSPFNEFIQGFTPSASEPLSFLLATTENVGPATPDSFSLGIFDSSGTGIPTLRADIFVQVDITAPLAVNTYASDPDQAPPGCPTCPPVRIGAPRVQQVSAAEPGALLLLMAALGGLAVAMRCRWV